MTEPSEAFWRHYGETTEASSDMRAARNLRRRIRRDPMLSNAERDELLKQAQYVPGCLPLPVDLVEPTYP
jgi:hypothetical protein